MVWVLSHWQTNWHGIKMSMDRLLDGDIPDKSENLNESVTIEVGCLPDVVGSS